MTQTQNTESKSCGHAHHVGTCPSCQRAQLHRWHMQLAQVKTERSAGAATG